MSGGLVALLDDIASLAKLAAASIDDIAGQSAKAGVKAAGVVIDDTAVTPRYVTDFSPARELPIIGRIALGSLRNKLLILLPAALALSYFLPGFHPWNHDDRALIKLHESDYADAVMPAHAAGPREELAAA